MTETAEQYRNRMLSHVKGQKPVKIHAATPQKLSRLFKGVPASRLRKRPAPGKWSAHEILMHLSDTEIVWGFRVRLILGSPGCAIPGFNQDDWVISGHYSKRSVATALAQFAALRAANVELVKNLRPEQLKHFGIHSERGEESVETIVAMMAGHDVNHMLQIERIVKPAKANRKR